MASSSSGSIMPPSASAPSPSALSAQDAAPRLRSAHEAMAEALESQDAAAQLAALKIGAPVMGSLVTNFLRALFALGGFWNSTERPALTSPTPSDRSAAFGRGFAPAISAPLT